MKNKKLFAILTLVCFMFTLMPVAAFAADNQVYVNGNEKATVVVGGAGYPFQATVGTTTADGYDFFMVDEDGEGVAVSANGSFTYKTPGTYKVYALAETTEITNYINSVATAATKVATLQAAYADAIDANDYAKVTIKAADMDYKIKFQKLVNGVWTDTESLTVAANNGFNAGDSNNVKAVLLKSVKDADSWSGLKGMDLELTVVGYADVAFVEGATTDKNGVVEFEVTSGTAGSYQVIAKWNKTKATLAVTVDASNAVNVTVNAEPAAPVNVDATDNVAAAAVEFKFVDNTGAAATAIAGSNVELSVVEQPTDSELTGANFDLTPKAGVPGVYTLTALGGAQFEEGTYKIKAALANGVAATATVKVAEMGDVVGIKFVKAPVSLAYTSQDFPVLGAEGKVYAVDANGVTDAVTAELSVSGKAVKAFADNKVSLTVDEDYIGSTITVYAIYKVGGETFTASNTLKVIDSAATIAYTAKTAEVGVTTKLYAHVVDANGNVVALAGTTPQVIVLEKPENAVVVATPGTYAAKTGQPVSFLASAAGEYKIQTIITYWDGSATRYLSSVDTITVGGGVNTFNDVVILSIGATSMIVNDTVVALDVAPYVEAGRTMMQYTALKAFGIDFEWFEETRSVVAEGNGIKVVMTIGSKVAVVNGVEVEMEVAPQIINGRTVVPVTYITNVFGITPQCIYAADGTVQDVLFTK